MAQAGVSLEHDQFNCSICLDVLKDPVTVPCGHNYCKACIKGYWDQDDYLGVYGCPQCRQSFTPRPVLGRNTMLADVVDKLKNTTIHSASATKSESTEAEPGDVPCDACTGNRNRAVKSCLVCLASYCEDHLKPHYESTAFQKHRLTAPTSNLQDSLCPRHDRLLEFFCRTEQRCICYLCLTDEHKGHDTVLASAESSEKKDALADTQRKSRQKIEEREKELEELRRATQSVTLSAQVALDESERIFTELVCSIERRRTEVKELIRSQEKEATRQAEELFNQLEREIVELKKQDAELNQLAQIDNQISFLQNYGSVCVQPVCMEVPGISVDPGFGCVMNALSEFQALLNDVCQGGFVNISEKVSEVTIIQNTRPKTAEESNTDFQTSPGFQPFGPSTFSIAVPMFGNFTMSSPIVFLIKALMMSLIITQRQLEEALRRWKHKSREKVKELRSIMKYLKRSAQAVEEDSEKICTKLLRSIERRQGEVKELLRAEERVALTQAENLIELLDQQTEDTSRKEAVLELLSNSDDHIHFLLKCKSLLVPSDPDELPDVDVHPYFSLLILRRAITELRERVNDVCDRELVRISDLISPVKSVDLTQIEPKTRADFLHFCCDVTLDPNTANSYLYLSEGNRKVSTCYDSKKHPEHPDRLGGWAQVLARDAVSTRCYWEVEWSGNRGIGIGVSYKGINRHTGNADRKLDCNSKSWSLNLYDGHCTFQHNKTKLEIPSPISARIGVYVDHQAGILAFYCISPRRDTMNLLHRIHTTFSQPLYPGFWLGLGSTLKLCSILKFPA
ncbi:E3 ubiquitin/ISG15 ligase TRIM25 [Bagarius yarrelli]|uniref:E3 ubiquitin/ISG15 ligase TRIM25 n=1 Tax=Bagarius yarrelli TaxID=175774 RepID=A0A556V9P3_BAGYA|nr:E3 ubiquitin/ISG15 ligase TRIM25 [Bagarius yarrelli]